MGLHRSAHSRPAAPSIADCDCKALAAQSGPPSIHPSIRPAGRLHRALAPCLDVFAFFLLLLLLLRLLLLLLLIVHTRAASCIRRSRAGSCRERRSLRAARRLHIQLCRHAAAFATSGLIAVQIRAAVCPPDWLALCYLYNPREIDSDGKAYNKAKVRLTRLCSGDRCDRSEGPSAGERGRPSTCSAANGERQGTRRRSRRCAQFEGEAKAHNSCHRCRSRRSERRRTRRQPDEAMATENGAFCSDTCSEGRWAK